MLSLFLAMVFAKIPFYTGVSNENPLEVLNLKCSGGIL
jgi:hypothetical protein